jgi:hypothetical protein
VDEDAGTTAARLAVLGDAVENREVAGSIGRALEGQSGLRTRLLSAVDSQAPAETALRALLAVESTSTPRPSSTAGASR